MVDRPSVVSLWVVGFAEEVVDGCVVQAGELDEDGGGDVVVAGFVLTVARLRHMEHARDMYLGQVMIFAHITNTRITHNDHLIIMLP